MLNFDRVVGGIGLLIFVYLLFSKASGATTVFSSLAEGSGSLIKILQGR
jgi:hypothetical protein